MKVTKHSTKLFLICRFFNFFLFFDKVTCDVNGLLRGKPFPGNDSQKCDVFPRKVHVASDSQCVVSVTFSDTLWMRVLLMSIF